MIPRRLRCEFYWPHFTETSAVGVPSLRWLCLQCNCSILLLPLYILCLKLTAFAFAVPLLALNLKSTFSVLGSFACKSFPARISSHLLNPLLLSLLLYFICLRYWGGDSPTVNVIIIQLFIWRKPGALSSMVIGCLEIRNALWRHYSGWCQGGHQPNSIDLLPTGNHAGRAVLVW